MAREKRRKISFEDISSYTSKQAYKKNRKKRKKTGVTVILCIVFASLIFLGGSLMCVSAFVLDKLTTTTIAKDDESLGITANETRREGVMNIALFGVDSRKGTDTFVGKSDAVMVLSVDTELDEIKVISLLRDARVYLGDRTPNESGYDKLNHAYAHGGPEFAIRTLNQTYGLDIRNYVSVNLSGMAEIIDAFGGVDVEVTAEEIEQINNNIGGLHHENPKLFDDTEQYFHGDPGFVHLNGVQAVAYGRIRNIDSDNVRAERQQKVLSALFSKLTNIPKKEYPALLSDLLPLVETSLSVGDILELANILMDGFTMETLVIPGDAVEADAGIYENDAWMWTYDPIEAAACIHDFIYETESSMARTGERILPSITNDSSTAGTENTAGQE